MRNELSRLRGAEEDAKNKGNQVSSLLEELQRLKKELSATQKEKKTIEDWAQTYRDEMEKVSWDPLKASVCCSVVLILHLPVSSGHSVVSYVSFVCFGFQENFEPLNFKKWHLFYNFSFFSFLGTL